MPQLRAYLSGRVSNVVGAQRRRVVLFPQHVTAEVPEHVSLPALAHYLNTLKTDAPPIRLRPLPPMTISICVHVELKRAVQSWLADKHDEVGLAGRRVQLYAVDDARDKGQVVVYGGGGDGVVYEDVDDGNLKSLLLEAGRWA